MASASARRIPAGTTRLLRPMLSGSPFASSTRMTRSLSQLGIGEAQWPEVEMINLPVNQDACKGATFQLDYSAAVTKP